MTNLAKPVIIPVPPHMARAVSEAILAPVIMRIRGFASISPELVDWIDQSCQPHEREMIKLSRQFAGLQIDDAALDASWTALVETYGRKSYEQEALDARVRAEWAP